MKTKMLAVVAAMAVMASAAWALDTNALRPPAGARMAIVVFEDLQCPSCGKADPLLLQAERNYKIPLVRHDYPIKGHNWSMEAHVMARYFDTVSPTLGEEFRRAVFANQSAIFNNATLRDFANKFAAGHMKALPAFYDPRGELRGKVLADAEIGKGIEHTPTIYIVSDSKQTPYVEVPDQGKLFETIEKVKSTLGPAPVSAVKAKGKK